MITLNYLTLKDHSRLSPPHMSIPTSYPPNFLKYLALMANAPPDIVGVLGGGC